MKKLRLGAIALMWCVSGIAFADCVKPVFTGENLWKLVKRIGECMDESFDMISSAVDVIACADTAHCPGPVCRRAAFHPAGGGGER